MVAVTEKSRRIAKRTKHASRLLRGLRVGGTSTTNLPNTVYTYDAGGRLTSEFDSATGITTKYTYKPDTNYVQTETVTNAAGTTLASYTYSYRNDGLKTGETDVTLNTDGTTYDTRTLSWTYDGLDRLTQEKSVESAQSVDLNYTDNYSYDLNSNRTGETEDQGNTGSTTDTITSTYPGAPGFRGLRGAAPDSFRRGAAPLNTVNDELTQAVDANTGTTVYGYDANGSQTSVTHTPNGTTTPDSTTTNEYDLQGQLAGSQVTTSAGTATTTYFYDDSGNPDNNLSSLEIGTGLLEETTTAAGSTTPVVTYYLVDTNNPTGYSQPIEQSATPGTPQITYIWGAQLISQTYATGATIPGVGTASSPTTYYLLQDAHGSTRLIADANGNIVARYNYDGFGNALGFSAATALTTYLYSSMPFDAASGNYYDHARFYDSGTGEFTQADYGYAGSLANPMTDLHYMYGGGDPINMMDLNGHVFSLAGVSIELDLNAMLTGLISHSLIGAATNIASNLIIMEASGQAYTWGNLGFDSLEGAALGAIGGGIGGLAGLLTKGVGATLALRLAVTVGKVGVEAAINTLAQIFEYRYKTSNPPDWPPADIVEGLFASNLLFGTMFETISTAADQAVASAQNEIAAIRARFKMSGGDPAQAAKYFNDWAAGRVTDADLRSRLAFLEGLAPGLKVVFGDGVVMNVIDEFSKSLVGAFSSATLANPS